MSGEITERIDDPSYQGGDSTIYILGFQTQHVFGEQPRAEAAFQISELRVGS